MLQPRYQLLDGILEIKRAVLPDSVRATTSLISIELVASLTADATTSSLS